MTQRSRTIATSGQNATRPSRIRTQTSTQARLRSDALALAPVSDPVAAAVIGGTAGAVDAVLVEGVPIKWNGRLLDGSIDRARALVEATRDYVTGVCS